MTENYINLIIDLFPNLEKFDMDTVIAKIPEYVKQCLLDSYEKGKESEFKLDFDEYVGYTLLVGIDTMLRDARKAEKKEKRKRFLKFWSKDE